MSNAYDEWKATTPDDELAAAEARQARREAMAQRAEDRHLAGSEDPGSDPQPRDPDAVSRSLSEVARLNATLGPDWCESAPVVAEAERDARAALSNHQFVMGHFQRLLEKAA